jgi:hypothetical protein
MNEGEGPERVLGNGCFRILSEAQDCPVPEGTEGNEENEVVICIFQDHPSPMTSFLRSLVAFCCVESLRLIQSSRVSRFAV